ncbi:pygopus homolog 1 [Coregonus clupeaformis]|uniref:PHD-type domain-containing protein n=1 Tax=Coregonus suidteri TaxID=861788 RepID=A0AAN8KNB3_9TELE|nr:pygopus homolog 1 [Coregonus clupeaformis]
MSKEQDKDTFSLKRNRGGDGGLDDLGGPGVLLGSPDKKKCKSNTQAPSFAPLSEYAPPPNRSADHLVAANPFDDDYNTPSFKPLSSGNPYFGHPHYPGFSGYGPPRMDPLMPNRMPSSYRGLYQIRNQLHPFAQTQMGMGFSRPPDFNYGYHENPNYGNHPPLSNNNSNMPLPPNQPFRPGLRDNLNQVHLHNVTQSTSPDMGPSFRSAVNPIGNPPLRPGMDSSPGFTRQQQNNSFTQSKTPTPKQDLSEVDSSKSTSQNTSPRKRSHGSEEIMGQKNSVDLKSKNRGALVCQGASQPNTTEKINGIILPNNDSLKKSPQSGRHMEATPLERSRSSGGGGVASNKTLMHPNRPSHSSTEPVFPCGICLNEVNDDQEAILCEASCQKWFHRVCTGMTETAYNLLTAEVSAVWGCDVCMEEKGAQLLRTKELTGQPAGQQPTVNSE